MWQSSIIMQNGNLIPFADARVHPLSLGMAYATTVFEGMRAYRNPGSGAFSIFRLADHVRRLQSGMKVMRFGRRFEYAEIRDNLARLIEANAPDDDVYIRLLVYVEAIGFLANTEPVGFTAAASPRERSAFVTEGMQLGVSSWSRLPDNASPPRIKATANYHNARLAQLQAKADGYDGALMLTPAGKVSETPIACFFMVRDGRLITPNTSSNILESITRDTVITLHDEMNDLSVDVREVDRSELYVADEAFICGTGQEIIPVVGIDRLAVGNGCAGPVTRRLQERYYGLVRGEEQDQRGWLTPIFSP